MGKTFRDLSVVTTITSSYILAVSREDTEKAFKTTINDLKAYTLDAAGETASFSDLNVTDGIIKSADPALEVYVNSSSVISSVFIDIGIQLDRIAGKTIGTSYVDLGTSFVFSISSSPIANITATSLDTSFLRSPTYPLTSIQLESSMVFNVAGVGTLAIPNHDPVMYTQEIKGASDQDARIQLVTPSQSHMTVIGSGGNEAIQAFSSVGQVEMPNRNVVVAYDYTPRPVVATVKTPIVFAEEVFDPLGQFFLGTFNMNEVGVPLSFIIQLSLSQAAWSSDYAVVNFEMGLSQSSWKSFWLPLGTYTPYIWFMGFCDSRAGDFTFTIDATKSFNINRAHVILKTLRG